MPAQSQLPYSATVPATSRPSSAFTKPTHPAEVTASAAAGRHPTATLLLEQGVELVVIKELLGHAHIGVTATVYANTSDSASNATPSTSSARALGKPSKSVSEPGDGDDPPLCAAPVR